MTDVSSTPIPLIAELPLAAAPQSVSASRAFVQGALSRMPADLVATATLLVSELVTNAVVHAHTDLLLTLQRLDGALRVQVADRLPLAVPRPIVANGDDENGRGLMLVAALSARWGTERDQLGKRVWFEIPFPVPSASDVPDAQGLWSGRR